MQVPPQGADHEKEDMRTFIYAAQTAKVPRGKIVCWEISPTLIVTAC